MTFEYLFEKKILGHAKNLRRGVTNLVNRQQKQPGVYFISGVQRSGTTMILEILNRSADTEVFFEGDGRAYRQFGLCSDRTLETLRAESSAAVLVVKNFTRAHLMSEMLNSFDEVKVCWAFRNYEDVISSNIKRFEQKRNFLDDIVKDRNAGVWRARGMTDVTYEQIRSVYHAGLNDESAQALFWYYRNQLLFDQNLNEDERVLVFDYDRLLSSTYEQLSILCRHVGIRCNNSMVKHVRIPTHSTNRSLLIDTRVRTLCNEMYDRLNTIANSVEAIG